MDCLPKLKLALIEIIKNKRAKSKAFSSDLVKLPEIATQLQSDLLQESISRKS